MIRVALFSACVWFAIGLMFALRFVAYEWRYRAKMREFAPDAMPDAWPGLYYLLLLVVIWPVIAFFIVLEWFDRK